MQKNVIVSQSCRVPACPAAFPAARENGWGPSPKGQDSYASALTQREFGQRQIPFTECGVPPESALPDRKTMPAHLRVHPTSRKTPRSAQTANDGRSQQALKIEREVRPAVHAHADAATGKTAAARPNPEIPRRGKTTISSRSGFPSNNGTHSGLTIQANRVSGQAVFNRATAGSVWMMSPKRTRLENENRPGRSGRPERTRYLPIARRSARRLGKPAARIFFCAVWISYSKRRSSMKFLST